MAPLVVALVALVVVHLFVTQLLISFFYRLTHNLPVAMLLYAVLVWPGTVLHEFAHWLVARLLGVRASLPHLLPSGVDERGRMVLGHVMVERSDPLRRSLIGLAPLVAGSAAVAWLARHAFALPLPLLELQGVGSVQPLLEALPGIVRAPDAWLWLYGVFAIANAMMPSPSDREAWPPLILFAVLVVGALYFTVGLPQVPPPVTLWAMRAATWLTFAFVVTVLLDVALLVILLPLERALWALGR